MSTFDEFRVRYSWYLTVKEQNVMILWRTYWWVKIRQENISRSTKGIYKQASWIFGRKISMNNCLIQWKYWERSCGNLKPIRMISKRNAGK